MLVLRHSMTGSASNGARLRKTLPAALCKSLSLMRAGGRAFSSYLRGTNFHAKHQL
ncbi:MAG: hypothetical protein K2W86_13475 [Sphingomonas sp.]|nr:hypothetical protein [Sphingomonas sp.]